MALRVPFIRPAGHVLPKENPIRRTSRYAVACALLTLVYAIMSVSVSVSQETKYQKFTIYKEGSEEYGNRVIVVFHGFASAMPNGAYKRIHQAFSGRFTVIGVNYDYFDLAGNKRFFSRIWNTELKGREVIVAGTSLGGYWANYFASEFSVPKAVLVNPVVDPEVQLRQFIGTRFVAKRNEEITVTADDVARYRGIVVEENEATQRLVILTTDDPVLDYRVAKAKFSPDPKNQVLVFEDGGGHTLNLRDPRFLNPLREFLGMVSP